MVAIVENIGAGLVNRNGARCCGAVWFLARMNLKRFKMQILFTGDTSEINNIKLIKL